MGPSSLRRYLLRGKAMRLQWNTPSIGFYRSLGARPMSDWEGMRFQGDELAALERLLPAGLAA
jgi:hypothetical protein